MWYIENVGFWATFRFTLFRIAEVFIPHKGNWKALIKNEKKSFDGESLKLKPGELVEVKSEEAILDTLDKKREHNGLVWMIGMRRSCGKKYRVFKRVKTIRLEATGRLRKMNNTVLLEGLICDGSEYWGCDRSCFYFGMKCGSREQ